MIKSINESKIKMEPAYLTSLTSEAWNMIGNLKLQKEDFKKNYKNANKVVEAIEELTDAYLIYVGQLEAILATEGIEPKTEEEEEIKESLKEELETVIINEPIVNVTLNVAPETEDFDKELEPCEDCEKETEESQPFEFFCDFDSIIPEGPRPEIFPYTKQ
jgi:hypothetical protein